MDYLKEIRELVVKGCELAGRPVKKGDFEIVYQPKNHIPKSLPNGKIAIYTFLYNDKFLKIGKAGKNSKARYQSHHYHTKSGKSTLANRLVKDDNFKAFVNEQNVKSWIKENCERYDIIIDKSYGNYFLNFIEGLLHYKYNPMFEG